MHAALWAGLALLLLAGMIVGASSTWAVLTLAYRLRDGRQVLHLDLALVGGLLRYRWRQPGKARHGRAGPAQPGKARHGRAGPAQPGKARHGRAGPAQPGKARHGRGGPGQDGQRSKPSPWRPSAGDIVSVLRGQVWANDLRLVAVIGTGDPAQTALAIGVAHALVAAAAAALASELRLTLPQPVLDIRPDYTRARLAISGRCILRCRLGHLMVAAARIWLQRRHRTAGLAGRPGQALHH